MDEVPGKLKVKEPHQSLQVQGDLANMHGYGFLERE